MTSLPAGTEEHWTATGVCFRETPDAPELWTSERRPAQPVWTYLQQMCQRCPVRTRCAAEAVAAEQQSGIYAGVFVPERRKSKGWSAAMDQLREIAAESAGAASPRPGKGCRRE